MITKPGGQGPIARRGCGKLSITELSPDAVDHGGVMGLAVSVDPLRAPSGASADRSHGSYSRPSR
jgi:hypothetical protein